MSVKVTFRTNDMWVGFDLFMSKGNCVVLAMCELMEKVKESCSVIEHLYHLKVLLLYTCYALVMYLHNGFLCLTVNILLK